MKEFLEERGWVYGRTRYSGWLWAHRNLPRGVYFVLEAAFEVEKQERVSARGKSE